MKSIIFLLLVFLIACSDSQRHVWEEIERCQVAFDEPCSVVVIPNSKHEQVKLVVNTK